MSENLDKFNKISTIENYLKTQYNIKCYNDNFIESYLSRCDYNVASCQKKIENLITYKKMYPEYLLAGEMQSQDFRRFCKSVYSYYLPDLANGHRVFIDRVTDDESLFDVFKIIKYYCMQTEIRLKEDTFDDGDIILFDCNNINFMHLVAFVPYFIKALLLILTIYPLNLKCLVLINTGRVMEIFLKLMKFILPSRIDEKLQVYSDGNGRFSAHVKSEILPKEYGGSKFSLNDLRDAWFNELLHYQDWFSRINKEIETANYENFALITTTFGLKGSFKSLQVD